MYTGKFKIWGCVLAIFVVISCIAKINNMAATKNDSVTIKEASFGSDNRSIAWCLDKKKLTCGTKLVQNNTNWDFYITEGEPLEGYKYEEYYSPIVALYDYNILNNETAPKNNNDTRSIDLLKMLDGCIEKKTYTEIFPAGEKYNNMSNPVEVILDVQYEKEIKQSLFMLLARKTELTQEDYDKYADKVNYYWKNTPKAYDVLQYLNDRKCNIVITAEYHVGDNSERLATFSPTIATKIYLNYKDGYEDIVKDEGIMRRAAIRRLSYNGTYTKDNLNGSDWSLIIPLYDERVNQYISLEENGTTNTETENTETAATAAPDSIENVTDNPEDISEETSPPDVPDEPELDEQSSDWDINKKEENGDVSANRDINPNAYGAKE